MRGEARRVARVRPGDDGDDEFVAVWVRNVGSAAQSSGIHSLVVRGHYP